MRRALVMVAAAALGTLLAVPPLVTASCQSVSA